MQHLRIVLGVIIWNLRSPFSRVDWSDLKTHLRSAIRASQITHRPFCRSPVRYPELPTNGNSVFSPFCKKRGRKIRKYQGSTFPDNHSQNYAKIGRVLVRVLMYPPAMRKRLMPAVPQSLTTVPVLAQPDCLLIVYQCSRTHPHTRCNLLLALDTGLCICSPRVFAHSVPVWPYTLAASSPIA
jgi:hypothetical protein